MKLTKILTMLTLLSLMMFSCDSDSDAEDDALVGSWTLTDEGYGYLYSSNLTFTSSNVTLTEAEVCIDDDESEYYCYDDGDWSCSSTGTWSVNEDQLTFGFPQLDDYYDDGDDCVGGPVTATYSINGNSLTLTFSESYYDYYDYYDGDYYDYTWDVVYTRD